MNSNLLDFPTTYVYQPLPSRHVRLLEIIDLESSATPRPEKQSSGHRADNTVSQNAFLFILQGKDLASDDSQT
jgi:hypothetical protein